MENIIFLCDILIIILSIWVLFKLNGYGGFIGKALNLVGYGIVVIGFAQIIETLTIKYSSISTDVIELAHRLVLLVGIILLSWGFKILMTKN